MSDAHLGNIHGSNAAGFRATAMARFASPLGPMTPSKATEESGTPLVLSDDSLGLSPPGLQALPQKRPITRMARSTSGHTMVLRSCSTGRKRNFFMKPPFTSVEKRFKNIEAPIQAVDGSAEARIAA